MKCTVTLTDKIQPGSVRVTTRLATGEVMRFNRGTIDPDTGKLDPESVNVTWSGELPIKVARDLRLDGFAIPETTEEKAVQKEYLAERKKIQDAADNAAKKDGE